MDDLDLQSALGGEISADAAETTAATDDDGSLDAIIAELDPTLADDDSPDEDEAETDDEDEETDLEAIKRERDELRQAKRDAEARATAAENEQFWVRDRSEVDGKLREALNHLDERMQRAVDPAEVVREYLPRLIHGYTQDLTSHFSKREQAWERIARQHGAQTYRQEVQREYRLSESAMDEIAAEFPPEQWHSAARLHARSVAPIREELAQTTGKLTKAQRAVHAERLSRQIAPGAPGRASNLTMADALDRITEEKAPAQLMSVLRLSGVA